MGAPHVMETDRLRLVPLDATWAAPLADLYADEEVSRHLGGHALDAEATAAQLRRFTAEWEVEGWGQSAVLDRATGELLGRVGLHRWATWGDVELGYVLARDRWGRGLAHEASRAWLAWADAHLPAADPPVTSLTAVVEPANAASLRLAGRLGFTHEREDVTPRGVPVLVLRRSLG